MSGIDKTSGSYSLLLLWIKLQKLFIKIDCLKGNKILLQNKDSEVISVSPTILWCNTTSKESYTCKWHPTHCMAFSFWYQVCSVVTKCEHRKDFTDSCISFLLRSVPLLSSTLLGVGMWVLQFTSALKSAHWLNNLEGTPIHKSTCVNDKGYLILSVSLSQIKLSSFSGLITRDVKGLFPLLHP